MDIKVDELYRALYSVYGDTGWWPGETVDEIVFGTILTQNTSWKNVEISIKNLKNVGIITLEDMAKTNPVQLGLIIRSSGFYNQKSLRLILLSRAVIENYGTLHRMKKHETSELERFLTKINGVGQETMDCILLYALDKPVFVVDKYTLRILNRIGISRSTNTFDIKSLVETELGSDVEKLKNFHGMIVNLAKDHCRTKPRCSGCPMAEMCDFNLASGH